ncbi:unnamed protein product [Allacma fusca]|uniref:Uncharacterized protein n=1 Tax=Allacma fusca TaxID=39272 RepID=A0A8J2P4Q0_9HEXA|nr:unnamed protein product [Allacma fusca]
MLLLSITVPSKENVVPYSAVEEPKSIELSGPEDNTIFVDSGNETVVVPDNYPDVDSYEGLGNCVNFVSFRPEMDCSIAGTEEDRRQTALDPVSSENIVDHYYWAHSNLNSDVKVVAVAEIGREVEAVAGLR